jgi:hypothetical protein
MEQQIKKDQQIMDILQQYHLYKNKKITKKELIDIYIDFLKKSNLATNYQKNKIYYATKFLEKDLSALQILSMTSPEFAQQMTKPISNTSLGSLSSSSTNLYKAFYKQLDKRRIIHHQQMEKLYNSTRPSRNTDKIVSIIQKNNPNLLKWALENQKFKANELIRGIQHILNYEYDIDKWLKIIMDYIIDFKYIDNKELAQTLLFILPNLFAKYSRSRFTYNIDLEFIELLLKKGAMINLKYDESDSLLHMSLKLLNSDKQLKLIKLLIKHKININAINLQSKTSLDLAIEIFTNTEDWNIKKKLFRIIFYLVENGAISNNYHLQDVLNIIQASQKYYQDTQQQKMLLQQAQSLQPKTSFQKQVQSEKQQIIQKLRKQQQQIEQAKQEFLLQGTYRDLS